MTKSSVDCTNLKAWLDELGTAFRQDEPLLARLEQFFNDYGQCRNHPLQRATGAAPYSTLVNAAALEALLVTFREPLKNALLEGVFINPWDILGIASDEIRHSKVLAWLLKPSASHAHGFIAINTILELLYKSMPSHFIPNADLRNVQVSTEQYIDAAWAANRVDILLTSPDFYILIEVKINALEGDEQINRYCLSANQRANDRPWAVIFLTKRGYAPNVEARWQDHILPISWRQLASLLTTAYRAERKLAGQYRVEPFAVHRFVDSYLETISNLS
jgi:hypothetical protein